MSSTNACTVYALLGYVTCVYYLNHTLQELISSREGHKTIGKKLGKMFSRFRTRGKSVTLDNNPGPTAKAKLNLPSSPSLDVSDDEDTEEVRTASVRTLSCVLVTCIHYGCAIIKIIRLSR